MAFMHSSGPQARIELEGISVRLCLGAALVSARGSSRVHEHVQHAAAHRLCSQSYYHIHTPIDSSSDSTSQTKKAQAQNENELGKLDVDASWTVQISRVQLLKRTPRLMSETKADYTFSTIDTIASRMSEPHSTISESVWSQGNLLADIHTHPPHMHTLQLMHPPKPPALQRTSMLLVHPACALIINHSFGCERASW